ncbi:efflux RND transporter periplasmic adaptor subunit [candidate division KSB1 bacterium]|nr:efflux RND transporter periplasmic adaptor subunit [candidate division KSB1 bacterium]RQW02391.1 MAG: efflux RND transporter periplasmic adaptor subunit [candidate division KSB1 bacterium]
MISIRNILKGHWKLILIVAVISFCLGLLSRPASRDHAALKTTENSSTTWTCSMHPHIRQPQSGKCPICAMDLIPVAQETGGDELGDRQLKLSSTAKRLARVQTTPVERRSISTSISLYGKISIDERRAKSIASWVAGRIEKLHIDYTGAMVQKGDPLVDIYSSDLYVAQQEYLTARNSASSLLDLADITKKFALWGITEQQLEQLNKVGEPTDRMTIYAPISGIVLNRAVSEGQYVDTGALLYDIADLSRVWIYLDAYEKDLPWLQEDQDVTFVAQAVPGRTFAGKIDFINPVLDEQSRTVKVRATADNPSLSLKPGLLISAQVTGEGQPSSLVIPASAPLITGERAVVYVAIPNQEGVFEGREISLGERSGDYFVVQTGLVEGEQVVTNGAFKIDSEMQILAKKSMMSDHTSHKKHPQTPSHVEPSSALSDSSKYSTISVSHHFVSSLDAVFLAYFDIQDALAHDKTDIAKPSHTLLKALKDVASDHLANQTELWTSLSKRIESAASQLTDAKNIAIARAEFKQLSDALIQTTQIFGVSGNFAVKQYHCPMAFDDAGADWLSPKDDIENPYFGAVMFSCGWRVKTYAEDGGAHE